MTVKLSDRGFTQSRSLSYLFEGTTSTLDTELQAGIDHNLGRLPDSLNLQVDQGTNWEQQDPAAYVLSTTTQLVDTGTTLASVVGASTQVKLIVATGSPAISVVSAGSGQSGVIASAGTQTLSPALTLEDDLTVNADLDVDGEVKLGADGFSGDHTANCNQLVVNNPGTSTEATIRLQGSNSNGDFSSICALKALQDGGLTDSKLDVYTRNNGSLLKAGTITSDQEWIMGPSSGFSGQHTIYTGSGATAYSPLPSSGTIVFGNLVTNDSPSIVGRSDNTVGLYLGSLTRDSNTAGDMIFDVREEDDSDFSTLSNNAYRWRHNQNNIMTLTRGGDLDVQGGITQQKTLGFEGTVTDSTTFASLLDIGSTNDNVSENWILFAKAYSSSFVDSEGAIGTVLQLRGGSLSLNITERADIICQAAYNANVAYITANAGNSSQSFVLVDYNGTRYIALKIARLLSRGVFFQGTIWGSTLGEPLLITDASQISNETAI